MAETAEEFAIKLMAPLAAIAIVLFFIRKILGWVWISIVPYAIPVLWVLGILFALGVFCFIFFMRAGMNRFGWKMLVFSLECLGAFGVVVYCGNDDKLPWARRIVDSMSWAIDHPVIVGIGIIAFLTLAVTLPLPGLGHSRCIANSDFMRGFEEGKKDQ